MRLCVPVHLCVPVLSRESFPRASPSRGHRRLPEGSLAVSVPNQSPHLPSTPVSHSLERLRVPTACLRGFEIICHSACLLSLPINLITCGRGGPGGHFCALLCLLQASIFLTPGSRTLPGLSCLAPSPALMDVSGWMPPFHLHPYGSSSLTHPHPSCGPDLRAEPPEHPLQLRRECVSYQAQGASRWAISPPPLASWEQHPWTCCLQEKPSP